ncbi:MAG TPA: PorV/PorQ family protein [candidate division Zixibacteria bacterium]|nr:PorV/PorQ family protein [candidate division Zixibacteria bacterium]
MKIKVLCLTLVAMLLCSAALYAGGDERIGTSGAQELRIPVGSRMSALAGAGVAEAVGAEALYWNPAGVAYYDGTEVMFTHLQYFADIDVNYFAATTAIEDFGSIGLSAKVVSFGDIEKTTVLAPEGTGEILSPSYSVIGLTYSRRFTDRVAFGATGMLVNERIDQLSATGVAFDFGFVYDPGWQGLKFGLVVKNYGPQMRFSGSDFDVDNDVPGAEPGTPDRTFRSQSASFELPSSVQLGASWNLLRNEANSATIMGLFQSNNFSEDEFRGGIEYAFNDMFFLRGGYVGSTQDDYMYGPSVGAGLKMTWGNTTFVLDYSWMQTEFFDNNQFFTVKFGF